MIRRIVFALLACVLSVDVSGQIPQASFDLSELRRLPVLDGNRYKPFDAYARDWVTAITGELTPKRPVPGSAPLKIDPLLYYLDWMWNPSAARAEACILVDTPGARTMMGLAPDKIESQRVSYDFLTNNAEYNRLNAELRRRPGASLNKDETELRQVTDRKNRLGEIAGLNPGWENVPDEFRGGPTFVPPKAAPVVGEEYHWGTVANLPNFGYPGEKTDAVLGAWKRLGTAWRAIDAAAFAVASKDLRIAVDTLGARGYKQELIDREVRFLAANPFSHASWLYTLSIILGIVAIAWRNRVFHVAAVLPSIVGLGYHAWGLAERTAISERAMIGNIYESLIFVSAVTVFIAVVCEAWWKSRWFLVVGALLGMVALKVALEHPTFMPPGISTLQPVLINNFWIHIHVPVIVASYAPLALAAVLANVWLVMRTFRPESCPQLREIARIQTWIVAPGVILLFAGLILGGIWADQSWGRFWGWDPKETWGLITMLVFVIVIHGRWVGWLRDFGVSIGNVLGGAALLFTYYGVNFFLSGLHSYAGAGDSAAGVSIWQKVPGWMWAYVVIQIVIVAAATIRSKAAGGGVASDGLGRA